MIFAHIYRWLAEETHEGLQSYLQILKSSDLTLCPVGKNSESYRIYEAMSVGSVPVIEDLSASQSCNTQPFRYSTAGRQTLWLCVNVFTCLCKCVSLIYAPKDLACRGKLPHNKACQERLYKTICWLVHQLYKLTGSVLRYFLLSKLV